MPPPNSNNAFRFSTEHYGERDRLSAWRDIFGRTVVGLDIDPLTPERFRSEATVCGFPGLGLLVGKTSAVHLSHSSGLIVDDDLSFAVAPAERWTATQLGRTAVLGPGDGILMWNGVVGQMTLPTATRFDTFRVPFAAIDPLVPDLTAKVATRLSAASPALQLLSQYLQIFRNTPVTWGPELQRLAAIHVHDLLAMVLGASPDAAEMAAARGVRAARLHAIKADIAANLDSADLSVATVAAQHGVTPRYVQILFEEDGTTFTEFVLGERLTRAYQMLIDPGSAARKIGAIAYEAGFGDLSYFNKAFRRRFGGTPSDVRASGLREAAPRRSGRDAEE